MTKPTVLISGAGIAGPALAYWLTRSGYQVTVVEIHDGIRPGGQTVDLRGAGRAVIDRMGLLDQMRARGLEQRGVARLQGMPDGGAINEIKLQWSQAQHRFTWFDRRANPTFHS